MKDETGGFKIVSRQNVRSLRAAVFALLLVAWLVVLTLIGLRLPVVQMVIAAAALAFVTEAVIRRLR